MREPKNQKFIHDIAQLTGVEEKSVEAVFKAYRYLLLHYIATEQDENGCVVLSIPYFIPFKVHKGKKDNVLIKVPPWARHRYFKQIEEALLNKRDFLNELLCNTVGANIEQKLKEILENEQ